MTWIYAYPAWAVGLAAVLSFGGIAAGSALVLRAAYPAHARQYNDVAGPVAGVVGTILAVLLSFMLVVAWQEYDQAAGTASAEASAVVDLYRLAAQLPPVPRARLADLLGRYATVVVTGEWPAMRAGHESARAGRLGYEILAVVLAYEPHGAAQQALQAQALTLAGSIVDSRRDRLFANRQGIPGFFYAGIAAIVGATFLLCALFDVRTPRAHVVMTAAVGIVVGVVLFLIAEFDYPFRGDVQIPPSAWAGALAITRHS